MRLGLTEITILVVAALLVAATADAQEWRGMGRMAGKVVDESGQPIEGVTVKAMMPDAGNRGPEETTNKKGEWAIGGIAGGRWALDFIRDGYETRRMTVNVSEGMRVPPMNISLKKKATPVPTADPNVEIKDELVRAAGLMNKQQYSEARAIYEALAEKYPDVKQFRPLIARAYYGEGNKAAAIENLRKAAAADPANVEVQLLLGNVLVEEGQVEEGRKLLDSVDESKVTDPVVYINVGIVLLNERKYAEAVTWFDRAIARFAEHPDAYYYRGISFLSLGKREEARADLQKFVSLAPEDAPELETAKRILESIK